MAEELYEQQTVGVQILHPTGFTNAVHGQLGNTKVDAANAFAFQVGAFLMFCTFQLKMFDRIHHTHTQVEMEATLLMAAACRVAQCEAETAKLISENAIRELRIKLLVMEHKLHFATHLEPPKELVVEVETPAVPQEIVEEPIVKVNEEAPKPRNKKRQVETKPLEESPPRRKPSPPRPPQSSTKKRKLLVNSKPRFSTSSAASTASALRREMFSFTTRMQAPKLKSSAKQ